MPVISEPEAGSPQIRPISKLWVQVREILPYTRGKLIKEDTTGLSGFQMHVCTYMCTRTHVNMHAQATRPGVVAEAHQWVTVEAGLRGCWEVKVRLGM